jgi:hypothetical protein
MRKYLPPRLRRFLSPLKRRTRRLLRGASGVIGDYRYVFVVTYGRSGSTLLMGLLNTIAGYRVNGENYNALYRLYQADLAIARSLEKGAGRQHLRPTSAWYGTPRVRQARFRDELAGSFVRHVLRPGPGDRVLGFKEIRYTKSDMPDLEGFLGFLRRTFPQCKIIVNHRKVSDVAKSAWWARSDQSLTKLEATEARLQAIPTDKRHFHFHYDEIDDGLDNIRALFRFLGEEVDEPAVRRVLATRHAPRSETYAG